MRKYYAKHQSEIVIVTEAKPRWLLHFRLMLTIWFFYNPITEHIDKVIMFFLKHEDDKNASWHLLQWEEGESLIEDINAIYWILQLFIHFIKKEYLLATKIITNYLILLSWPQNLFLFCFFCLIYSSWEMDIHPRMHHATGIPNFKVEKYYCSDFRYHLLTKLRSN